MSSDKLAGATGEETTEPGDDQEEAIGTAASLSPYISPKWALSAAHLALTIVVSACFTLANFLPLRGADLWLHVLYGKWILEHGRLPTEEPFMPFSSGMNLINSQWLSQVLFASIEQVAGAEMISTLFAVVVLLSQVILARAIYVRTGSVAAAAAGVFLFVMIGWSRLGALRPEILALLCFTILLLLLTEGRQREQQGRGFGVLIWVATPLLIAVWTNLHGSFLCGLIVLGAVACGSIIESLRRECSLSALLSDPCVRRRLLLLELSAAATLLNPYGVDLPLYAVAFSGNGNLNEVLEWQPLVIFGPGGRTFVLAIVLLIVLLRKSRAPMPASDSLLLLIFGVASLIGIRMLTWFAPLFALSAAPHLLNVFHQWWPPHEYSEEELAALDPTKPPPGRSFHYSLASVVAIWMGFALSPTATPLMGGAARTPTQLFGSDTPVGLSERLREDPPDGPLLCPQEWSDWLIFDGPEGLRPFITSNIHMAPRQVWNDYLAVVNNRANWDGMLERYRIAGVALDKTRHGNQVRLMRRNEDWRESYVDQNVAYFKRVTPTPPEGGELAKRETPLIESSVASMELMERSGMKVEPNE